MATLPPKKKISWWSSNIFLKAVVHLLKALVSKQMISAFFTAFVLGFALFQKRVLPPKVAALAAKVYFYPTLPLTYLRLCVLPPRAGLWTEIDDTVIVGAAPVSLLRHPQILRHLGVRGVVNCCAEYPGPDWSEYAVEHLRVPTIDHVEPSKEDLERAVLFIDDHAAKGNKVYIHCKAGHGRSAAVAFAWLCHKHHGHIAPFDLFQRISSKRKVRKNLWRQPNILAFYDSLPLRRTNPLAPPSNLPSSSDDAAAADNDDDDDDDIGLNEDDDTDECPGG